MFWFIRLRYFFSRGHCSRLSAKSEAVFSALEVPFDFLGVDIKHLPLFLVPKVPHFGELVFSHRIIIRRKLELHLEWFLRY